MTAAPERPHFRFWPRFAPRQLTLPQTSLWTNLEVSALRYPDKAAFVYGGRPTTYRELKAQAEAIAGWLQREAGVARGHRVILYMQNCPQFSIAYYGILRADAVVVPVNPMNRAEELRHYITDPAAKVAITTADLAGIGSVDHDVERVLRLDGLGVRSVGLVVGVDIPPVRPDDPQLDAGQRFADRSVTRLVCHQGAGHHRRRFG